MSQIQSIQNTADFDNIEPITPIEKIAIDCPQVLPIIEDEERLAEEHFAAYETHTKRQQERREEITGYLTELARNDASAKPSAKLEERLNTKIEKLRADMKAADIEHEAVKANRPGSAIQSLRESFFHTPEVHKRYRPANTTDTLLPGKTARGMCDHYREQRKALTARRNALLKAHVTAGDIRHSIAAGVERAASRVLSSSLAAIKRPDLNERTVSFSLRSFEIPTTAIVGATMISNYADGAGLLCALFPDEVTERLTAMALANHDPAKAIPLDVRADQLREIDAAISVIDYRAEFFHRMCRAEGSNSGPRFTSNPLAVLDIVRA